MILTLVISFLYIRKENRLLDLAAIEYRGGAHGSLPGERNPQNRTPLAQPQPLTPFPTAACPH